MKKIALFSMMLLIIYLSNVPNLYVSNPTSWFNPPMFEKGITLTDLFQIESVFYSPWGENKNVEFFLHKLGHVWAYGILTLLMYVNLKQKNRGRYTWFLISVFAILDEIHQYFVIGRSGRLVDVLLDSMVCLFVVTLLWFFKRKRKQNYYFSLEKKATSQ